MVSIDGAHMAQHWIPDHQHHLDAPLGTPRGRFAITKVYLHATVVHDPAKKRRLARARADRITRTRQDVLNWQHDQGDVLHESEVFHHLHQIGKTSFPYLYKDATGTKSTAMSVNAATSHRAGTRYSIKISVVRTDRNSAHGMYLITHSDLQALFPGAGRGSWCKWGYEPKISSSGRCAVVWQMQIDFVDLQVRAPKVAISTSRSRKRRRTINEFMTVPPAKKFRGVRWREERRAWMAETRINRSRNKVWFGDFKTEEEAARAVDAAFYHYGKELNFADSAQILACKPVPADVASNEEKLKFVKEIAKWVADQPSRFGGPYCEAPLAADQGHDVDLGEGTSEENSLDDFSMAMDIGDERFELPEVHDVTLHHSPTWDYGQDSFVFTSFQVDSPPVLLFDPVIMSPPCENFQGGFLDCLMCE